MPIYCTCADLHDPVTCTPWSSRTRARRGSSAAKLGLACTRDMQLGTTAHSHATPHPPLRDSPKTLFTVPPPAALSYPDRPGSIHDFSLARVELSDFAHQARMSCTSYAFIEAHPAVCWLYQFVNRCHAFEVWLGIPAWMSYFSSPDLPAQQLHEGLLLLAILAGFGLVAPISDILRPSSRRGWFRRALRWLWGFITAAWVAACVVRAEPAV